VTSHGNIFVPGVQITDYSLLQEGVGRISLEI